MNTDRPCGCKSFNSCYVCEKDLGIVKEDAAKARLQQAGDKTYLYCPDSEELTPIYGQNAEAPTTKTKFPGFKLIRDFISAEEEARLVSDLDNLPWSTSQSGRRKQNFGPKANFKKRKAKAGNFNGFPASTQFVQDRFSNVACLKDYRTVEQCSIEYRPETGACIEPHIDDCWIWGERIVQLNLLTDSHLTLFPYIAAEGNEGRYNLPDVQDYPRILDDAGRVIFNPFHSDENVSQVPYWRRDSTAGEAVRIPLPRRSLLVMYGEPRYDWEHCILREDISERRIVIAYRELTPTYLPGGPQEEIGREILDRAAKFWS